MKHIKDCIESLMKLQIKKVDEELMILDQTKRLNEARFYELSKHKEKAYSLLFDLQDNVSKEEYNSKEDL